VHSLCFFVIGVRLWTFGRRHGYTTQIQFFRDRLDAPNIGLLLFPVLVAMVIIYLLIGIIPSGAVIAGVTRGAFPDVFPATDGSVPAWLGSLVICLVVLTYVFFGGMRGTAWANAFQTLVFMALGVITFFAIADKLGGAPAATTAVLERFPAKLMMQNLKQPEYFTYLLIPLSVGMFPHVFQHWLTARRASSFKLAIVAHPFFILIVWLPCVLLGVWATSILDPNGNLMFPEDMPPGDVNKILGIMVGRFTNPVLAGLLTAGILAAIMSSLDSQFLCLGTMFTEDIVLRYAGKSRFDDRQIVLMARGFIVVIVAITYGLSLIEMPRVFRLGIWTFSGFASLVPLAFASLYWRRLTKCGAYASVIAVMVSWWLLFQAAEFGNNPRYTFLGMQPVATMFGCATLALVAVSLVTKPPNDATLQKFFRPVKLGKEMIS
jgi:SSS family solute:Na+ symporter